ncbi:MAG: carbohydrate porin, partial [Synechococcaceae cyanobacterium]
ALYGATTLSYDVRLNLSTSFTGKDLLFTRLRSGNFNNAFNGNGLAGAMTRLDMASNGFGAGPGYNSSNVVGIDRLSYRFPAGKEFSFIVAGRGRNTEFLGANPSVYATGKADRLLDFFSVHGAPGVYNKATGAGFGLVWQQNVKKGKPRFSFSASWIAPNGEIGQAYDGNPYACAGGVEGGLFANCSGGSLLTQLAYTTPQFNVSLAYRYGNAGSNFREGTEFVASNGWWLRNGSSNSFALNSYWQPKKSGWLPSISGGWAINNLNNNATNSTFTTVNVNGLIGSVFPTFFGEPYVTQSQSWFVGLQWDDVINKGNSLGFAIGQPTFATSLSLPPVNAAGSIPLTLAALNTSSTNAAFGVPTTTPQDGGVVIEAWYKWQVTDNISITPGVFWLSRPLGQATAGGSVLPPAPFSANAAGAITQAPLSAFTPANLAGNFTPAGTPDWTAGFGIFGAIIQTVIRF